MPHDLSAAINEMVIRRLAGEQSYQRGLDYFSHGHVETLENLDTSVRAVVRGNHDYTVTLLADDGVLDYACDCPAGIDGSFCKHCVAASLAWLDQAAGSARSSGSGKARHGNARKEVTLADAGKLLEAEDKSTLVRMMVDWAKEDDRLRERLILYAARRAGPDTGAAAVRRAFEKAVRIRDFVPYGEATSWARDVDRAIGSIEQLLHDGQAAAVIELCETSLQSLLDAVQRVDDSGGHFGELRDRLQDIHYRACEEARPDPAGLATRLFHWELHSDFDVFFGAVARYSKIFGDEGMKVYRELAEAEWAKIPARTARQERSEWGRHFRITNIMESLAKTPGDIEQLLAVMSRDLSSAYSYLKIAEVYLDAGRHEPALLWAEKGLEAFKERTDCRLREFAAEEYHRRHRHDDAMKLIWAEFSERPFLNSYKTLERHAKKASAWSEWRERALAEIRLHIKTAKEKSGGDIRSRWMQAKGDNSQLVEIFLYEGNPEEAWREAQAGGCSDNLWLRLAAVREKEYPADAAPIYLKQADAAVAATRNGRYEDSVDLLVKAASVMRRMDAGKEFAAHLEGLRVKYKIKRNFIKAIEQKRKSLYVS